MKLKKITALLAVSAVVLSMSDVYARVPRNEVTLIVELKGEAALESEEAVLLGASAYGETDTARRVSARIMSEQERVQADIKAIDRKAEAGFTYTNVINGFSVKADKSDIDKIKALDNVENVYIAGAHRYIEPIDTVSAEDDSEGSSSDNCCERLNVPYMHSRGYRGQGQAIAVIDSELDVNHEFFASPIDSPKYSKADISRLINEKNLNVKVSANRVWRSEKIPFAYSYGRDTADVYSTFLVHGSHVCGIAAGKDGRREDGTLFSGVAPEAQIIFMGVLRDSENLPDDALIAALDDASKMDVAAINMSLGADYTLFGGGLDKLFDKAISNAVNAGIEVCAASGNANRKLGYTTQIDYSASGLPAAVAGSTSVASASGITGEMSYFSSWGTDTTLELKPEITASGGSIYSSVPDDKYAVFSGTSMATPHMTGAAALMRQYIEDNYSGRYTNPARFIENLTMTAAKPIYQNSAEDIFYSPRNQGAGLIDLEAAATTPVILIGEGNKTKISLKDNIADIFRLEFTAKNFTDTDVTYDTITPSVFTDDHMRIELNGLYAVGSKMKKLKFTASQLPESITVPADGEVKIAFNMRLDSQETAENFAAFPFGFYIDGFVALSSSDGTVPDISIPYTGFYGSWTAAPAFGKPYYEYGKALFNEADTFLGSDIDGCICEYGEEIVRCHTLGKNKLLEDMLSDDKKKNMPDYFEYEDEAFAGISPNGDGAFDSLCVGVVPNRPMTDCGIRIENDAGVVMDVKAADNGNGGFAVLKDGGDAGSIPYDKFDKLLVNCVDYEDLDSLADGNYTVYVTGRLAYEGSDEEEISMRFYVDTSAPRIDKKEIRAENGKTYLDLSISDDRYVMGAIAEGKYRDGTAFKQSVYTKPARGADVSVDITDADIATLTVTALDYAYNKCETRAAGELTVTMPQKPVIGFKKSDFQFTLTNDTYKTINADIIAAVYKDGVLEQAVARRGCTVDEGVSTQAFEFNGMLTGRAARVFVFDTLENMKPLGHGECFTW